MLINNRKDLDAASADERTRFMAQLGGTINKWRWNDTEWEQYADISTIERFGFTLSDFPDAPVPTMPDYNPDEKEIAEARTTAYARITQGHADALAEIDSRYPLAEKLGWNRLDKSLDKYHAEGAITPGLQLYADQLGVSVADASARLDGAIDVYDQAYHDATGKLTRLRDAVDAAETVEELEAAQW